ncbi:DUF6443 domain-containing protein [Maribacter sp. 2308TA10-17]|uniref:DUF6443 domain-containing protein n=1 Tax=Maribacter sp. 2308TA10-17 TaxID=3386276 RepID=UPI0039BD50BC
MSQLYNLISNKWNFLVLLLILGSSMSLKGQFSIQGSHNVTVGQSSVFFIQTTGTSINSVSWSTVPSGIATITPFNTNMAAITFNSPVVQAALEATVNGIQITAFDVTASYPPPPNPNNPTIASRGCGTVQLSRNGTPPTNVRWYWQGTNPNGFVTNLGFGSTYNATVPNTGSYTYYVRARNTSTNQWSSGTGSVTATINKITPVPNVSALDSSVCAGQGTSITASNVSGATYRWYDANDNYLGFQGATYGTGNLSSNTTFKVSATVNGCESPKTPITIDVSPAPIPYNLEGSVSELCVGDNSASITLLQAQPNVSYQLFKDGTESGSPRTSNNGLEIVWTGIGIGTYKVEATGCSLVDMANEVTITTKTAIEPTVTANPGPTNICPGESVNLVVQDMMNPQWRNDSSNTDLEGGIVKEVNPPAGTSTTYSVTGEDACGIQTTKTITLVVLPNIGNVSVTGQATLCMGDGPTDYDATLTNANVFPSVTFSWSITSTSPLYTTTIDNSTGEVQWDENFSGQAIITAQADNTCETNENTFTVNVSAQITFYLDKDRDGYSAGEMQGCTNPDPVLYVTGDQIIGSDDCDDDDPEIILTRWYEDFDMDGLGDPNSTPIEQCDQPVGDYIDNNDDLCPTVNDPTNYCSGIADPCFPQPGNFTLQITGSNYVYSRNYQKSAAEMLAEGTNQNLNFNSFTASNAVIQEVTYFDGLGRPIQQIGIDQTPNNNDIITHMEYDGFGRMVKEYLPYATTDTDTQGSYRSDALTLTEDHYDVLKYQNTLNPYSEKKFDKSALNRVLRQAAPGADWAMDAGHEIEFEYLGNTHDSQNPTNSALDNVRRFIVTTILSQNTYSPTLDFEKDEQNNPIEFYSAGELYKSVTKDENHSSGKNHTTEEYTNKSGQVILKRTYANNQPYDTQYVYDNFGNLSFVLSPKMNASSATLAEINTNLIELAYQYVYDHRNRMVEKRIPGKGKEYIIYNKLDQPIMTQDANQRLDGEWLFTKYDAFGRVAYTGKAVDSSSREAIQTVVDDLTGDLWVVKGGLDNFGGTDIYYNNGAYPIGSLTEILTINYYDDYNFDRNGIDLIVGNIFNRAVSTNVRGLATGSKVKVLETNDWITSVTQYEDKGRPIYAVSKNDYLGTLDVTRMRIDFVGRTLKSRTEHTRNGDTVVTIDNFIYDHVGRLLAQTQCVGDQTLSDSCEAGGNGIDADIIVSGYINTDRIATNSMVVRPNATIVPNVVLRIDPNATGGDSGEAELIALNSYDELGRLDNKKVGGDADATDVLNSVGLQTVNYDYNVRNWLTAINDVNNPGDDLFNFRIGYNEGANPLFNGNIALTQWKTLNNDTSIRTYDYTYDALNRIETATDNLGNYSLSGITYDKNGNIDGLNRTGNDGVSPTSTAYGIIDNLDYAYGPGNKLLSVTDAQTGVLADQGFKDGNKIGNDYDYDANGNMIQDLNKGIPAQGITYNHLNLPEQVSISGGTIAYVYDATGVKQKKTLSTGSVTDYAGNYIYEDSGSGVQLKFFNHPEGYVEPNNGSYIYIYQCKDHIGNIRLSFKNVGTASNMNLEIQEENNYYPFGLKHKGYNSGQNGRNHKYGFGSKEEQEDNINASSLDWLDFGARNYNPSLGRWMNLDPLAEQMRRFSPYNYTWDNPIIYVDPDGMFGKYFDKDGNLQYEDGVDDDKVYQVESSVTTNEDGTASLNVKTTDLGVESDLVDTNGKTISSEETKTELVGLAIYTRNNVDGAENAVVSVNSGDRSTKKNRRVGGSTGSRHIAGDAADINISGLSQKDAAITAADSGLFSTVIYYPERGDTSGFGTHTDEVDTHGIKVTENGISQNTITTTVTNDQKLGPHVHVDNKPRKRSGTTRLRYTGHNGKRNTYAGWKSNRKIQ